MGRTARSLLLAAGAIAFGAARAASGDAPVALSTPAATQAAAALRVGATARAAGDPAGAAAHFAAAAQAEPAIASRARRLEAEAWLAAGRAADAERAVRAGLAPGASTPDVAAGLYQALGAARSARGDARGARAAWREALAREPEPARRAALQLALAESLLAAGETEAAVAELRALWTAAPERDEARRAGERLAALEAGSDRPLRSAADALARADRLFALQHSEAALAAYDAALAAGLTGRQRARADRRRADCLFRLRRYAEAEAAFAALGPGAEERLWRARAQARQGAVEEAIAALEALGAESHGAISAWARQLAGQLHAGRRRGERARALFASVVDDGAASESVAGESLWWLGWSAWEAGERAEAQRHFAALAARHRDPLDRLAARYWEARARGGAEGEAALATLAGEYPFSYYGWRAAQRVAPAPATPPAVPPGRRALDDAALLPARILVVAGLAEEARRALGALDARAAGLDDRLALATLHAAAGDWSGAQGLVASAYGERLARGPANGPRALWRLAWPEAFAAALDADWPAGARIDRALVLAVMREESRYQPDAVSVTGALGLLQIMPDTGARLAREVGLADFTPEQLFDPRVSLRLGSHHLDRLAARFDGALAPAVAGYNAGAEAVAGWLASGPREEDAWVEAIPYAETRAYVKRVLRSRHVYRTLAP
jgi:soluble lytic murein transglycosylase-like protein